MNNRVAPDASNGGASSTMGDPSWDTSLLSQPEQAMPPDQEQPQVKRRSHELERKISSIKQQEAARTKLERARVATGKDRVREATYTLMSSGYDMPM